MSTLGEQRVRTSFNPANDTMVDQIKQKTAQLIDLCSDIQKASTAAQYDSETIRLVALAQTHYELAAMWAVKAATAGKP